MVLKFEFEKKVFLILISLAGVYLQESAPHVDVAEGSIMGKKFVTNKKTPFYGFLDIPYAKPPIGKLRFQESQPIGKWDKDLDATANKKICVQFSPDDSRDPRENEDCLVLNVYVPMETFNHRKNSSTPVIIWIHGGSFRSWDGTMDSFGPHYFMDENIVVVSLNYRLGPLGFLYTGDGVIPGNLGLKDQLLAIKWVSKNIKNFGGDSNRVTLMGQSAGAMCVGYHLLNPNSKGLFSAAIMQSASPLLCASLQKFPKDAAYLMGSAIDKTFGDKNSTKELLQVLQRASIVDLKNSSLLEMADNKLNCQRLSAITWAPVTEPKGAKKPVITGMNFEKVKNGFTLKIPLLIGFNSQESLYYGTTLLPVLANFYDKMPFLMVNGNLNLKEDQKASIAQAFKTLYTNSTFLSNLTALVEFNSDNYFAIPTITYGYYHSRHSDVYSYLFSFKGLLGNLNSSFPGVGHGEDLKYLFQDSTNEDLRKFPRDEVTTHERLVALWAQFVKYQNPTKTTSDLLQQIKWPKFEEDKFSYLEIGKNLKLRSNPRNFKEWLKIFDKFANSKLDTF